MVGGRTKTGIAEVDKVIEELRKELLEKPSLVLPYWWASNDLLASSSDRYMVPGWTSVTNNERGFIPVTSDGRLRHLVVQSVDAGVDVSPTTLTFVVRVNKKDTVLSVSYPNVATGVFKSRMDLDVPVKAGDLVSIVVRKSAAITSSSTGVVASLELVV